MSLGYKNKCTKEHCFICHKVEVSVFINTFLTWLANFQFSVEI